MIEGIGIDLVELSRIRTIIANNPKFIQKVLTVKEFAHFEQLSDHRKVEFLGGRFACKEAFAKAYGTGIGKISLADIEVLPDKVGRPVVTQSPFTNGQVHVSITHTHDYAMAQILLERNPE